MKEQKLSEFDLEVRNGQCTIEIIQHSDLKEMVSEEVIDEEDGKEVQKWWEVKLTTSQYDTGADMSATTSFIIYSVNDLKRLASCFTEAASKAIAGWTEEDLKRFADVFQQCQQDTNYSVISTTGYKYAR